MFGENQDQGVTLCEGVFVHSAVQWPLRYRVTSQIDLLLLFLLLVFLVRLLLLFFDDCLLLNLLSLSLFKVLVKFSPFVALPM